MFSLTVMVTRTALETIASSDCSPDHLSIALQIYPSYLVSMRWPLKKLYKEKPKEYVSLVVGRQKRLASVFHEHVTKYHSSNSIREAGSCYDGAIYICVHLSP